MKQPTPILAVRLGRGRTGGTTGLDWLIQRAQANNRPIIVADGDKRNATLSGLYNGKTMSPPTDETADVKDWISSVLNRMAKERTSVALDLGGGDRVLQEYGRDLDMVGFCDSAHAEPLALYFLGPEADDLEHAYTVFEAEVFRPKHMLLVLNEGLVKMGQSPASAFRRTIDSEPFHKMLDAGAQVIYMTRLPCMDQVRELRVALNDTAKIAEKCGPVFAFMVKRWLDRLEDQCTDAEVTSWLP